jgi:hypothetical protein
MSHTTSISQIGDKLIVGQIDTSFLSATSRVTPGTAVLNGPVIIGATGGIGVDRATCMIGPPLGSLSVPASLEVIGITNIIGTLNVPAVSNFLGLLTASGGVIINAVVTENGIDINNALDLGNDTTICNAPMIVNSVVIAEDFVSGGTTLNATYGIAVSKKPFDILHPTKEGKRLRYVSLEGPSAEVYVRGTLKDSNTIELPDYWKGLVNEETIGVLLTPIGVYQELYWEKIEWGSRITVKNNLGSAINCHYVVYGERKDTTKNIPEYNGLTPNDYPGDNEEYFLPNFE